MTSLQCTNFNLQCFLLIVMIIYSSPLFSSPPIIQDISGIAKITSEILNVFTQFASDQINDKICQTNANVTGYPFR